MRIASIVLACVPYLVMVGFLPALSASNGPEGFGIIIMILYACALLTVSNAIAVVLAFLKRPATKLDIPSRVVSIFSLVVFGLPGAFGAMFFLMSLSSPALSY